MFDVHQKFNNHIRCAKHTNFHKRRQTILEKHFSDQQICATVAICVICQIITKKKKKSKLKLMCSIFVLLAVKWPA